ADILPILRPGDYNSDYNDATDTTDDDDSVLTTMSPQISGLPTVPVVPPGATVKSATVAVAPLPATNSAGTSFSSPIPILPASADEPYGVSLAGLKVPMLRPGSEDLPGISDGVVSTAVDAKRFWGVQVGAYSRYTPARLAAEKAQQNLPAQIKNTRV